MRAFLFSIVGLVGAIVLMSASPIGFHGDNDGPQARVAEPAEPAEPPLASLAFLTGTWQGEMNDGEFVEEIWSAAKGDAMMGMFRWLNAEGQPRMYEMLTISHENDETILRLRHYSPKMIAWEEKDAPVTLRLAVSGDNRAVFANMNREDRLTRIVFHQSEPKQLAIDVEFQEGTRAPLNFRLTRLTERVW